MNCLHSPDDSTIPGFGCPGKNSDSLNVAPIDPTKNNNSVCSNPP